MRPSERSRFLFFASLSGLINLSYTLGLAGAEGLFLARVGAAALPETFLVASAVSVVGSLLVATLVGRLRNDVFFVALLLVGMAVLGGGSAAIWRGLPGSVTAVFCLLFLAKVVYESHYWTFTWDYFDTLTSKRLFPLFLIGQSIGGTLGGALAVVLMRFAPAESLIAAWAGFLGLAALALRLARRPLRRWGPLELEEKDETSVEAIRGAVRYIGRSPLARWLVVSTLGLVLALFVMQYVYSEIFAREFPRAEQLARFIGIYLAVTNLIEVAVVLRITPLLIQRLGVPTANLLHPALTLLTFGVLALDYSLGSAVWARANRELIEQSLAQPVRTLGYNPVPLRFRGRLRLFMEGAVWYSGMALAGAALLLLGDRLDPLTLCGLGGAVAIVYALANAMVRREYVRTLSDQLAEGRLDLAELGTELGRFEVSRLAELWETLLAQPGGRLSRSELDVAGLLVARGITEPVLRAARHESPRVRRACVEALSGRADDAALEVLHAALEDEDAGVRGAAVRAAALVDWPGEALEAAIRARLADPDPRARVEAALCAGPEGLEVLRAMLASDDRTAILAALRRLPLALAEAALPHAGQEDPEVRSVALECLGRAAGGVALDPAGLTPDLGHGDPRVRRAALGALAATGGREARDALARALADPSHTVRTHAALLLGSFGEAGLAELEPQLAADHFATVEAALEAAAAIGTARARIVLRRELRRHVEDAWRALLALHVLPQDGPLAERFLALAYRDLAERSRRLAFRVLELLEEARVMRTVDKVLRTGSARARADALEVLSNLGDRYASQLLVLMLEDRPIADKIAEVAPHLPIPRSSHDVWSHARRAEDRWLRLASADPSPAQEEAMERLLLLREVPLFAELPLDQLEAVNQLMAERHYLRGEVIYEEGDVAAELHVLIAGRVHFYKQYGSPSRIYLNEHHPPTASGEMGLLADKPRSATMVAMEDTTLLTLDGARLKELILQAPELAFPLFRVLADRVQRAEDRLHEAIDSGQIPAPALDGAGG